LLSWGETDMKWSLPSQLSVENTEDFLSARYLLSASPHHYWVFLLLPEMQQKRMICRIVCPKSWADYSILIYVPMIIIMTW
jgi:hypothetical protein